MYDRGVRAIVPLVLTAACGTARPAIGPPSPPSAPLRVAVERAYLLSWRGARVGDARERETWDAGGVVLDRRERIRVRRGGHLVETDAAIEVRADRALAPSSVTWREDADGSIRAGRATRAGDGRWRIEVDGEAARPAPAAAIPEELVPLRVRRDGGFRGPVLLTGRGFMLGDGRVVRTGPGRLRAEIATRAGALRAEIATDRAGDPLRIVESDGVVARRADPAELAAGFDPPEVVDGVALPVRGAMPAGRVILALRGVARTPPPGLPGQRVAADGDAWRVVLDPTEPGELAPEPATADRTPAIRALAAAVADQIRPDLAGLARTEDEARDARAGDCTTHALAFAARAADLGIATRIVTGWRLDGGRLVRHRWDVAWNGAAWLAVDPSYGEAPAAPRLIGLAIGGPGAADLALADLAFTGTERVAARVAAR
jgi:Transglutaminase-like superfamily